MELLPHSEDSGVLHPLLNLCFNTVIRPVLQRGALLSPHMAAQQSPRRTITLALSPASVLRVSFDNADDRLLQRTESKSSSGRIDAKDGYGPIRGELSRPLELQVSSSITPSSSAPVRANLALVGIYPCSFYQVSNGVRSRGQFGA